MVSPEKVFVYQKMDFRGEINKEYGNVQNFKLFRWTVNVFSLKFKQIKN